MLKTTLLSFTLCLAFVSHTNGQTTLNFESLPVPPSEFYNGDPVGSDSYRGNYSVLNVNDNGSGTVETVQSWEEDGFHFNNSFTQFPSFTSWSGFSWSNVVDTSTAGFGNQYASFAGGGSGGAGITNAGETYLVGFGNQSYFNLPEQVTLESIDITNTTYAGISMRDGDMFAKTFGGASGDDPDFFSIEFTAFDSVDQGGNQIGSVEFFLADYRATDNSLDYIINQWTAVDLSSLGAARSIAISFTTTDIGMFGPNTPAYAAFDNLTYSVTSVPEPISLLMLFPISGLLVLRRKKTKLIS